MLYLVESLWSKEYVMAESIEVACRKYKAVVKKEMNGSHVGCLCKPNKVELISENVVVDGHKAIRTP